MISKRAKRKNQAWGSNPESRPVAYHIGKSRLTIGPTRLNVVQPRSITSYSPSSLAHTHKGAKTQGGRPAYHWANPAECCSACVTQTQLTKLPSPYSQRCQNFARLRRALPFLLLSSACVDLLHKSGVSLSLNLSAFLLEQQLWALPLASLACYSGAHV